MKLFWGLVLCCTAYAEGYFLYQEAQYPRIFPSPSLEQKYPFRISAKPLFFNPKVQFYTSAVLVYDFYALLHSQGKQLKTKQVLAGISLNKIVHSLNYGDTKMRFILGSGIYFNSFEVSGMGGLSPYHYTTFSTEVRSRFALQLLFKKIHMLEFAVQLPIIAVGTFGYEATHHNNLLFVIRCLYGGN